MTCHRRGPAGTAIVHRRIAPRPGNAVTAGLTLQYNFGPVEGTANRIKQFKAACTDAPHPTFCGS